MKKNKNFTPPPQFLALMSVILSFCLLFSLSLPVYADDFEFLSGEYKNRDVVTDYLNELQYSIPAHWTADVTTSDGRETRNYTIKTGTVLTLMYMPLSNSENLTGNYSYVNAIVSSITNGMTNYSETSRLEGTMGNYPSVTIGYTWTSSSNNISSCSLCVCTNQGAYAMTFMMSQNNKDSDLLNDMIMYTFQNSTIVSYSDKTIIQDVQTKLNALGYDCGTPDGVAGSGTQDAIASYRKDKGLTDGSSIDAELLSSLNRNVLSSENNSSVQTGTDNSNPLLNAQVITAPVKSGDNSKTLGTYAYISITKEILKTVTLEQFTEFAQTVVDNSVYNWFSIICEDGTGICFSGSDIYYPSYGKLDTDGAITDGYGDITWDFDTNSYTYTPRQ